MPPPPACRRASACSRLTRAYLLEYDEPPELGLGRVRLQVKHRLAQLEDEHKWRHDKRPLVRAREPALLCDGHDAA